MADEPIIPLPPKNCDRQRDTNQETAQGGHKDVKIEIPVGNSEKGLTISEIAGGVIFVGIGCGFTEAELHYAAFFCYWISVAAGIDCIRRVVKPSNKYSKSAFWVVILVNTGIFLSLAYYQVRKAKNAQILSPIASPTRIELNDGEWSKTTPIDVFNPNDFPIYDLMLEFIIQGQNVRADSLIIEPLEEAKKESSIRLDYVGKTNGQIVFFMTPGILSRDHVRFNISGNTPLKSYCTVSVWQFTKEPSVMRYKNGATPEMIPPNGEIRFPEYRNPIGGTMTNFGYSMTTNGTHFRFTFKD